MDCNPSGSSVHRIFQARILEWIAISFSRGSSQPRDGTRVSHTVGRFFTIWATRETHNRNTILSPSNLTSEYQYIFLKYQYIIERSFLDSEVGNKDDLFLRNVNSSVTESCPTLFDPMDCSTPGFPVLHYLLQFAQTHGHQVSDVIQPSHPLLPPSPPAFNLSQHQGLFQWVSSYTLQLFLIISWLELFKNTVIWIWQCKNVYVLVLCSQIMQPI